MNPAASGLDAPPDTDERDGPHVPGEVGVWVFIGGDLLIFTALFLTYLIYRGQAPEAFAAGQRLLSPTVGMIETLVLILSSLLVVGAVRAGRRGSSRAATRLLGGALACGAAFSVLKIVDYTTRLAAGDVPTRSDFLMFWFLTTGLHWFHLLVGMAFLAVAAAVLRRPGTTPGRRVFVEGGACFWHMVDLLWIVIFPLLYLVR